MPSAETLERFIARVEQNAHVEAIEEFYVEGGSIRENQSAPRVGRAALAERERQVLARAAAVRSTCIRPVFVSGDRVVIRWVFEFDWKDGRRTRMEELAYQQWQGELLLEEQFFYDPAQTVPRPASGEGLALGRLGATVVFDRCQDAVGDRRIRVFNHGRTLGPAGTGVTLHLQPSPRP